MSDICVCCSQRVLLEDNEIYFVTTRDIERGEELFLRSMEPPEQIYFNLGCMAAAGPTHLKKIEVMNAFHYFRAVFFIVSLFSRRLAVFSHRTNLFQPGLYGCRRTDTPEENRGNERHLLFSRV